jgi:hypothetical protein
VTSEEPIEELRERVAALKHDLGKYVAWTSSNLEDAAWRAPLGDDALEALRTDLLRTRRRGEQHESAWAVWQRLGAALPRPLEPELERVERAVATLESAGPSLRDGDRDAIASQCDAIRNAQGVIRRELSALARRLREVG